MPLRPQTLLRTSLALAAGLALGCAWVSLTPAGQEVEVVANSEVMGCERLGTTRARVLRKVGFVPRLQSTVDRELDTLARNEAGKIGGNTVTPFARRAGGERRYAVYQCDDEIAQPATRPAEESLRSLADGGGHGAHPGERDRHRGGAKR